jgi:hypothetical protein
MTLRSRVTSRTSLVAGLIRYAAFAETHPQLPIPQVTQSFPVKSKAEADEIAESLGVRTTWRDGCYMAEGEIRSRPMEIHFVPTITDPDAS